MWWILWENQNKYARWWKRCAPFPLPKNDICLLWFCSFVTWRQPNRIPKLTSKQGDVANRYILYFQYCLHHWKGHLVSCDMRKIEVHMSCSCFILFFSKWWVKNVTCRKILHRSTTDDLNATNFCLFHYKFTYS